MYVADKLINSKLNQPMVSSKALQNWKIFVNSYRNDYTILAKLTKWLITIIIVRFLIAKINET